MKKIVSVLSIAAVLISMTACEHENLAPDGGLNPDFKVTATIEPIENTTRVGYTVDNTENTVTPEWQVDDQIFGFDSEGNTFTYRVSAVDDGTKEATLALVGEYTPGTASKAYAIYYPGKTVSNFEGSGTALTLAVDLSAQSGALNTSSPVLMCATADITPGGINFSFQNQTAIIGVKAFQLPEAATITSMDLNGVITTGSFSVVEGVLKLTPKGSPTKVTATGNWTTADDGGLQKVKTGVYFASLPTTGANLVLNASSSTKEYANVTAIASTDLVAGNYYYMSKILAGSVAEISAVKYATIDEAFAVANRATSNVTITLLADCLASGSLSLNDTGSGAVTLDMNGKDLTMPNQICVSGRTLTITDSSSGLLAEQGTIDFTYTGGYALYVESSGTLNFQGGTLQNNHTSQALYSTSSIVNMTGGKVLAQKYAAVYSTGMFTISGNAIIESLTSTAIYNDGGTLSVEGNARLTAGGNYGVNTNGAKGISYIRGNAVVNSVSGNAIYAQGGSTVEISGTPSGYSESGATIYAANGTINIKGGNFSRGGNGNGYVAYTGNASGRITISGGTFYNTPASSVVRAYTSGSVITVTGGYFKSTGINPIDVNNGTVYVKGGFFNKAIQPNYAQDNESKVYVNVLNDDPLTSEDYPYTLSPASVTPIVAVTTQSTNIWNHGSVESAFKCADQRAKANGGATVTMQRDDTANATMTVNTGNDYLVTLDLHGYTISSEESPIIAVGDDFTLNDLGSGGELVTTGATALSVTGGTTTINSGSVCGATNAVNVLDGKLNIYDGHFFGGVAADIVTTSGTITISGGLYRHEPVGEWLASGYASAVASEVFKTRSYNYQVEASSVVATVDGANRGSWAAAVAAACSYSGDSPIIVVQLLDDIDADTAVNLSHATKPIMLDLNGHDINVSVADFLNCNNQLTITDTGLSKGKIISSEVNVIQKVGTGTITLDGCVIASTAVGSSWYSEAVVRVNNSASEVIIRNGTKIYATKALTGLACRNGSATVTDSEISSGTENAGVPAINTGGTTSSLTINSGSFYSSATSRAVLVSGAGMAAATEAGTTVINGGYFYAKESGCLCLKGNYASGDHYSKITVHGGFFNKTLTWTNGGKKYYPTFGSGKSEQSCSVENTHNTTGDTWSYVFKVATK